MAGSVSVGHGNVSATDKMPERGSSRRLERLSSSVQSFSAAGTSFTSRALRPLASLLCPHVRYSGLDRWMVKGVKSTWSSAASSMVYDVVRSSENNSFNEGICRPGARAVCSRRFRPHITVPSLAPHILADRHSRALPGAP
jgi:hypothetical protein